MQRLAVFGSGSGSNAENIIQYFKGRTDVSIGPLVSNTSKSRFKEIAKNNNLEYLEFDNAMFANDAKSIVGCLKDRKVDWVILAGFLRKIDSSLIEAYADRIVNIHPSLLPNYGGPGMYGMNVHNAVFESKERESGITIHLVNENFDEGKIIDQKKVQIEDCTEPDQIRAKVQELEQLHFPKVIDNLIH